jgi:DNA invertase Pin-like site-specific DNA recombinase
MDRPGFQKLMGDIRLGKVKTVVVWRLDRLGRTASGLTALFDDLIGLGVNLVSLKDGIDLGTPAGKLMANIIASIAAYETEIRAERIQAGLAAKKERVAQGLETWNAGRPSGSAHKATPDVCQAVKDQAAKGTKKARIAKMFNLSRPTVYAILKGQAA